MIQTAIGCVFHRSLVSIIRLKLTDVSFTEIAPDRSKTSRSVEGKIGDEHRVVASGGVADDMTALAGPNRCIAA